MRLSVWSSLVAAASLAVAVPGFSQVRPSATQRSIPLIVGAGFSSFNVDFGGGRREDGGTVWADWTIRQVPNLLQGLGVELEARDLSFNAPSSLPNMRYDTAGGGLIYHFLRTTKFHPYAKFDAQFGSIDFPGTPGYQHDTRGLISFGGGADIHAWSSLWVRADYEYQMWQPNLFGQTTSLTPNGFTFGPEWDFGTW